MRHPSSPDLVVIGGGIMGLSTAWAATRAGARVTVLEQGSLPHEGGSSVDHHRLIRRPYGADEGYTRMIDAAHAAWAALWRDLGRCHYDETGTLAVVGGAGADWARASMHTMDKLGIDYERWSPTAAAQQWPFLRPDGIELAVSLPTGGNLYARDIVRDLAQWLEAHGADLRPHTKVAHVAPELGIATLADGRRVQGEKLVVAAGPWVHDLLPALRSRVQPSRQVVLYLQPPADLVPVWRRAPMLIDIGEGNGIYVIPPRRGYGLKVGDHQFSLQGHPDDARETTAAERKRLIDLTHTRFRESQRYTAVEGRSCYYTVAPEERFIVAPIAASERTWAVSGTTGHGFKFGAVIGLELARTLLNGGDSQEIAHWAAGGT